MPGGDLVFVGHAKLAFKLFIDHRIVNFLLVHVVDEEGLILNGQTVVGTVMQVVNDKADASVQMLLLVVEPQRVLGAVVPGHIFGL